VMMVHGSDC